jgi:hypothetical protein
MGCVAFDCAMSLFPQRNPIKKTNNDQHQLSDIICLLPSNPGGIVKSPQPTLRFSFNTVDNGPMCIIFW